MFGDIGLDPSCGLLLNFSFESPRRGWKAFLMLNVAIDEDGWRERRRSSQMKKIVMGV
jgi:hypothetical protein